MAKTFADILNDEKAAARASMAAKVPSWAGIDGLSFPTKLCTEQCSSEPTATYKAALAAALFQTPEASGVPSVEDDRLCHPRHHKRGDRSEANGGVERSETPGILHGGQPVLMDVTGGVERSETPGILHGGQPVLMDVTGGVERSETPGILHGGQPVLMDVTGGVGVDSWFFCKAGFKVIYNEMNPVLAEAAENNFRLLNPAAGIETASTEITAENIAETLDRHNPDIVYMDPARRSSTGGKVFRLADCTPNVLEMKDTILEKCGYLLLKLSPMADISQMTRELGEEHILQVHVVGSAGECKELLVVMSSQRRSGQEYPIIVAETAPDKAETRFIFTRSEEQAARADYISGTDAGPFLFEPGSALLKAGAFNLISQRHALVKAGRNAHLYFSDGIRPELAGLGKWFKVEETLPFGKSSFKEIASRHLLAEVTARGLHITSEELRKRLGIKSSSRDGLTHIFALSCDAAGDRILLTHREKQ